MSITPKCPVCNTEPQNNLVEFCENCGWEFIAISDSAGEGLKNYIAVKLARQRANFVKFVQLSDTNESLRSENEGLQSRLNELESELQSYNKTKDMGGDYSVFRSTHLDSVIIPNVKVKDKALNIFWEHISQLAFRFICDEIELNLPKKIVLLFKKNAPPLGYGNCDFSILVETKGFKLLSTNTVELTISKEFVRAGAYYVRFMNLNYNSANVYFIQNEKTADKAEHNIVKTLIDIT